jgi:4-azaleucine resistance transporter AzlC
MARANALRDALPVVVGYLPAGMTFGLLAREAGMTGLDTLGFSGIVFAGASQYMAIDLVASGTGVLQIIFATLLLNFRHFLMSASLARKLDERRLLVRMLVSFGVTDETFAVASSRDRFDSRYLATVNFTAWSGWLSGTAAGFAAGALLPQALGSAMGVALYALFAALLVPMVRSRIALLLPAIAAALLHLLFRLAAISSGWAFILAVTGAALIGSALPPGVAATTGKESS